MTLDQTTTGTGAIVETTLGPVQGTQADGVHAFLGIPYAAPPFGDLRMRPPEPHEPWTEVLDATRYGATVPKSQYPPPTNQFLLDPEIDGEDCLNLNVWTSDPSAGCRHARVRVDLWRRLHPGRQLDPDLRRARSSPATASSG